MTKYKKLLEVLKYIYWFVLKRINFSQSHEEKIILDLFKNKKNGFYLDVGCHHPKRFSNTASLYKKGWKGINIDPNRSNLKLFNLFRKRDVNLCYFVSDKEKKFDYHIFDDSALNGNIKKERLSILQKMGYEIKKVKKVKSITLNKILETHSESFNNIDLLDIDVEGHDFEVLKSIDLNIYKVNVILIEVASNELEIDSYLQKHDYKSYILVDRNKFYIKN